MAGRPKRAVVSSYAATRMVNKGVAAFMNVSAFEARLRQSSGIDKSVLSRILCSRMCATGSLEGQRCYMRKNVRMSCHCLILCHCRNGSSKGICSH